MEKYIYCYNNIFSSITKHSIMINTALHVKRQQQSKGAWLKQPILPFGSGAYWHKTTNMDYNYTTGWSHNDSTKSQTKKLVKKREGICGKAAGSDKKERYMCSVLFFFLHTH